MNITPITEKKLTPTALINNVHKCNPIHENMVTEVVSENQSFIGKIELVTTNIKQIPLNKGAAKEASEAKEASFTPSPITPKPLKINLGTNKIPVKTALNPTNIPFPIIVKNEPITLNIVPKNDDITSHIFSKKSLIELDL